MNSFNASTGNLNQFFLIKILGTIPIENQNPSLLDLCYPIRHTFWLGNHCTRIQWIFLKVCQKQISALAGVAQWTEHWPANQKVTGSIPGQGTFLYCRPGPWLGCARGNQSMFLSHTDVSFPLFLPPFSLKINKILNPSPKINFNI